MAKEIKHGKDAQVKAIEALNNIANIVGTTLGPGGRTILMSKRNSGDQISVSHTKDGFNVLNSLNYTDPVHDAVHKLCIQASANSLVASGDGTTSTLVLAKAFAKELVSTSNNPQAAARAFRKEINAAIEAIKKEKISGKDAEYKVALTSSNGDEELTSTVLEALGHSSAYGTVIVEKNPTQKERYKIDREFGYQAGQGYNPYVILAQSIHETLANNGEFVLRDATVIPYNGDLIQFSQIKEALTKLAAEKGNKYNLLIVAHEVSDDFAANLAFMNRKNPGIKIFISKTTRTAEINGAFQQLNDIAAFSGAKVVDGGSINYWEPKEAGKVAAVRVTPYKTFILGMNQESNWLEERAEQNKVSAENAPSQMDRDIINSRNASLTGGLVKLIIGGGLFSDLQERADRADDAIKSAQATMRGGALPGCGASYIRAAQVGSVSEPVYRALSSVHSTIMENYGETPMDKFEKGETVKISSDSIEKHSDFLGCGVADSFETVQAVITNSFELGLLITNLGGYSLEADLESIEQAERAKEILRGAVR